MCVCGGGGVGVRATGDPTRKKYLLYIIVYNI